MSKLYKNLQYDTDWVMQPGDPITSPDGETGVRADNDGTAKLLYSYTKSVVTGASGKSGDSTITLELDPASQIWSAEEFANLIPESFVGTITKMPTSGESTVFSGTFYKSGNTYRLSNESGAVYFATSSCDVFSPQNAWGASAAYTTVGMPAQGTKLIMTEGHTHTASDITDGVLGRARGGTGFDGTSVAINQVLASPASGSAGGISFRALTAADIPNIGADKITSGVISIDRLPMGAVMGTVAYGSHTHAYLTDGDYLASLPVLTSNVTLATMEQVQDYVIARAGYTLVSPQATLSTTSAPNDTAAVTLVDHAVNAVDLPSSVETVTFTFPAIVQGMARDFMLRLTIAGSVPTIYFQESGGGSITFDADGETWTNIQSGANLIMFTETKQAQA